MPTELTMVSPGFGAGGASAARRSARPTSALARTSAASATRRTGGLTPSLLRLQALEAEREFLLGLHHLVPRDLGLPGGGGAAEDRGQVAPDAGRRRRVLVPALGDA